MEKVRRQRGKHATPALLGEGRRTLLSARQIISAGGASRCRTNNPFDSTLCNDDEGALAHSCPNQVCFAAARRRPLAPRKMRLRRERTDASSSSRRNLTPAGCAGIALAALRRRRLGIGRSSSARVSAAAVRRRRRSRAAIISSCAPLLWRAALASFFERRGAPASARVAARRRSKSFSTSSASMRCNKCIAGSAQLLLRRRRRRWSPSETAAAAPVRVKAC